MTDDDSEGSVRITAQRRSRRWREGGWVDGGDACVVYICSHACVCVFGDHQRNSSRLKQLRGAMKNSISSSLTTTQTYTCSLTHTHTHTLTYFHCLSLPESRSLSFSLSHYLNTWRACGTFRRYTHILAHLQTQSKNGCRQVDVTGVETLTSNSFFILRVMINRITTAPHYSRVL